MISEQAFTETPVFVPLFTIIIGLDPPNTAPTRIRPHLPKSVVFPRGARTGLFLSVLAGFPFRAPPLNLDPIAGFGPGSQERLLMHINADPVHFGNYQLVVGGSHSRIPLVGAHARVGQRHASERYSSAPEQSIALSPLDRAGCCV